jgi:thioredoxin-like negative regulator of GroEL
MAEADALGRRALELHPSDGSVVAWVASMRRHRGETLEAAALLDRWTRAHGPEPHVAVAQAQLSLDSDRYVEALRAAEAALAVDPAAEEAFVVQIRALRALGRSNRARALLHHWIEHHRSTGPISRLLEEIDEDCRENP